MKTRVGPPIDIIAGARPNFVKAAAIIRALDDAATAGSRLRYRLIHTGQHYDQALSGSFFAELGIPEPAVNLGAGSGTQAEQTAAIMIGYEKVLTPGRPALTLVVGDVTSTMACAITARKMGVPVAHVEAGIRSGDWTMPEEINRVVTDSITDYFFTTSDQASANLRRSGAPAANIYMVGNTMIDTLIANLPRLRKPDWFDRAELMAGRYCLLTLHRPANVDDETNLAKLLAGLAAATQEDPVVFPVHPRTAKTLARLPPLPKRFVVTPPLPYLEFIYLTRHARAVITDSGGITEETTVLGVPCMTLRNSTERPETVAIGTNELLGTDPSALAPACRKLFAGQWKKGACPPCWDGHSGQRIVQHLERLLP